MKRGFILLLAMVCLHISAQDRINKSVISFDRTSKTLDNIIGWYYDTSCEEWVDATNTLAEKALVNSHLSDWYIQSKAFHNFREFCFRSFVYKEKRYFVLSIEYRVGYYRYPNIKEDWTAKSPTMFCLFTENEYRKLLSLPNLPNTGTLILKPIFTTEGIVYNDDTEKQLLVKIQDYLSFGITDLPNNPFSIYKSDKGLIRFLLPCGGIKANFDAYYYETTLETFSGIFIDLD